MKGTFPIGKFREMETPFYYYCLLYTSDAADE